MAEKKEFFSKTYKFTGGKESAVRQDPNLPTTKTEPGEPVLSAKNIATQGAKRAMTPQEFAVQRPS